jgi:hypothetical protein
MDSEKEKRRGIGGRPKKTTHLNRLVSVRFSAEEYEEVKNKAAAAGIRLSQLLRLSALQTTVKGRVTDEEKVFIRQLTGMAINLNQVAHKGNAEGFAVAFLTFSQYEEKIRTLIQKLLP